MSDELNNIVFSIDKDVFRVTPKEEKMIYNPNDIAITQRRLNYDVKGDNMQNDNNAKSTEKIVEAFNKVVREWKNAQEVLITKEVYKKRNIIVSNDTLSKEIGIIVNETIQKMTDKIDACAALDDYGLSEECKGKLYDYVHRLFSSTSRANIMSERAMDSINLLQTSQTKIMNRIEDTAHIVSVLLDTITSYEQGVEILCAHGILGENKEFNAEKRSRIWKPSELRTQVDDKELDSGE